MLGFDIEDYFSVYFVFDAMWNHLRIASDTCKIPISEHVEGKVKIMDDLDDFEPPRVVPYGSKSHPMYPQWKKMMDSCTDPRHPLYGQVGAKGITVMHRWYDFTKFVEDNEALFEVEPSKPAALRRNYIRRKNLKAGFNPRNIEWVPKRDAIRLQPKTIVVDTIHGKNMPLKELARYLEEHHGEPLPDGAPIHKAWVRVLNPDTLRIERKFQEITTIQAIKLHELRRRYKLGLDLLAPVREYGVEARLEDEKESILCRDLDRNRKPIPADAPYYVKNRGYV